jgi:regulator of sigma D
MQSNNKIAQPEMVERRRVTHDLIGKLYKERQDMLVNFCGVAGLDPYSPDKPTKENLQEFCEVMVDYLALGHFEVYQHIASHTERRQEIAEAADLLYPKIAEASTNAIAFNDKYDSGQENLSLDELNQDLSLLGETLAARIELEDELIDVMFVRS